jgi:hypothetical protein
MGRKRAVHDTSKTLAAVLGTAPVALALGIAVALLLPASPGVRFAIGFHGVIPVWVTLICVVFNARSARRAWIGVLGSLILIGLLLASALGASGLLSSMTLDSVFG